jgi:hypothetical protein
MDTLRKLILRVPITRLWNEFHEYMKEVHGEDWRNSLRFHKTRAANGGFPSCGKGTRGEEENDKDNKRASIEHKHDKMVKDVTAGVDAIGRFTDSTCLVELEPRVYFVFLAMASWQAKNISLRWNANMDSILSS